MWEWHSLGGGWFMWGFWLVLIFAIILLYRCQCDDDGNESKSSKPSDTPMEILEKRYARGEIDEEEFRRRKKELLG